MLALSMIKAAIASRICRFVSFALGAMTCMTTASMAEADTCRFNVGGSLVTEGPCTVSSLDNKTSYIAFENEYIFIYLLRDSETTWRGYWNEYESHAHNPIGDLIFLGECWEGNLASICINKS